jgi:hypothetical protein
MKFYTYMYLRQKGATPYYVGKGCGDRAYSTNRIIHRPDADARILVQYWGSEQEAFEMERWYIRLWGRKDNGTGILRNMTDGGEGASGIVLTPEARKNRSEGLRGRWYSEETRRKIGEANRGRHTSPETRRKMSEARIGMRFSDEHRRKMSETARANPATMERCRKMIAGNKDRVFTPETRRKISEAARRRYELDRLDENQLLLFYEQIHSAGGKNISGTVAAPGPAA